MNPCTQCGAPLRWIAEAGYWNCDRCGNRVAPNAPPTPQPGTYPPPQGGHPQHAQGGHPQHESSGLYPPQQQGGRPQHESSGLYPPQQQGGHPQHDSGLYPPQQQGYPPQQQGYPPQGYGHYPQHGHPPARGKGKLIAIILVALALAGGGIAVAVVMSKKGSGDGGGGGGFDSAEALAKATTEAMAAGDGDKLVSFTPSLESMNAVVDCPAEAKAANEQQAKESLEKAKKHFAEIAAQTKGSGATLKSAKTDGVAKMEVKVGEAVGPCKAKAAIAMTGVAVEVDYTNPADKSKQTHQATYGVMILDGKYYLLDVGEIPESLRGAGGGGETPTTPPTPPDTPQNAELTAARSALDQLRTEACACPDRACADQVLSKRKSYAEKYALVPGVMDDPAIQGMVDELMKCISAKMAGTPPEPPPIPPPTDPNAKPPEPATPGQGLPECEAYAKAAERFIKCSKVPKQSRDAIQNAVDTMRKNWGDPANMSPDLKKQAAETCVTLEKSMKDGAAAMGCK